MVGRSYGSIQAMVSQPVAERLLFLPGASGVARFWRPVIDRLSLSLDYKAFDYPGFGGNPPDPKLSSLEDLTNWIETFIDRPVDILAQSMGGVIAMQLALRKHHLVRHLVLSGTSGGVPMGKFNAADWRESYRREAQKNPNWFTDDRTGLSKRVAILPVPVLLIFGSRDAVAPLALGKYLSHLLPIAQLVTVDTDSHFFVRDMPDVVAPHIKSFLGT
jgi:pimeloyl-ACP methyl ester carboxylesterase